MSTFTASTSQGDLPRLIRLPPTADQLTVVVEALALGPTLVIHPSVDEARRLAARLRQSGYSTAVHPEQWARAAGGVDVVIGGRSAVWSPCSGMRSIVVLDEHDEAFRRAFTDLACPRCRHRACQTSRRAGDVGVAVSIGCRRALGR